MRKYRKQAAFKACASIIEQLEKRSLLSAVVGGDGTLTVTGTEAGDNISVNFSVAFLQSGGVGGNYSVAVNGTNYNFPAASITKVVINGQDGNDSIGITGSEEDDGTASAPVNVVVNEGAGNDRVNSILSEQGFVEQYHLPGPSVSVTAGNGNDYIYVAGSTGATANVGNGNDTLQGSANSDDLKANFTAGNGNDEIDGVSAGDAALAVVASVGTGHDIFNNGNDPDITVAATTTDGQIPGGIYHQVTLTGTVVTGSPAKPVADATVYVDVNNNGILDSDEPYVTTGANGTYELQVPGLNEGTSAPYNLRVSDPGYTAAPSVVTANSLADGMGVSGADFVLTADATAAHPALLGTSGSYRNQGNTSAKAVDGNLSTFFDAPDASGDFVALDFGSVQNFSQISFAPRAGYATRMVGGIFQGSDTADFGSPITLYTVTSAPAAGVLTTVNVSGQSRYVRYLGPANSYCNIAEMQFTVSPIPGLATISNGVLNITGTNGTDNLNLSFNTSSGNGLTTGSYLLDLNGQTATVPAAGITAININSKDGANDVVDISGAEDNTDGTTAAVPITITEGSGNDTVNAYRDDDGTWNMAPAALQPRFVVTVGNGNDYVSTSGAALETVTAGGGNDTIGFGAVDDNMTGVLTAGNGNDEVNAGGGMARTLVTASMGTGQDQYATSENFFSSGQINVTTTNGETAVASGGGSTDFTGRVLTSTGTPVAGVTVFDDANDDGILEAGENSAVTNAQGIYTVVGVPNSTKFPTGYFIRAIAPAGTTVTPAVMSESLEPGMAFTGDQFVVTSAASPTNPVVFGTPGTYSNGNTIAKAVDGNLSTYFDAPLASGAYVALDYGSPQLFSEISYAPRPGFASRMVGGLFEGANSPDFSGAVTLYTVTTAPVAGQLTLVNLPGSGTYRYVRYIGPANSYCNIAEMHFTINPGYLSFQGTTVVVTGTNAADKIAITYNISFGAGYAITGLYTVNVNGVITNVDGTGVRQIEVQGQSGDDNFNVSGLEQNNAGPSTPSMDVTVFDGDGNDTIAVNLAQTGWGKGAEPYAPGIAIIAGNGNDNISVLGGQTDGINAGNGNDTITASAATDDLFIQVQPGNGNDEINATSASNASIVLQAPVGTGLDSFNSYNNPQVTIKAQTSDGQAPNVYRNQVVLTGRVFVQSFANALAGVKVFLDSNNNGILDPGELSTTTNAQGLYAFDVPVANGSSAAITYNLRVLAPGYVASTPLLQETASAGTSFSGEDFALNPTITGTVIGTAGSYRSQGNTIANAFDQNLSTFFDGPDANGDWVGLDLGSAQVLTTASFAPRAGFAARMVGGEIQASNTANFSSGVVTLATITTAPVAGQLTTLSLSNSTAYRYYRYLGPANGYCNIAELVFGG